MNKKIIISIIIIFLLFVGVTVFWSVQKAEKQEIKEQAQEQVQEKQENQNEEVDTSDWKTYTDKEYGFKIKHPKDWELQETKGPAIGGDYINVIFEKDRNDIGMGINRFKIDKDPKEWYEEQRFSGTTLDKQYVINGYPAYYVEIDNPTVYLMHTYLIQGNKKIIWFNFMEERRNRNPKTGEIKETSFSEYLPKFKAMVNSIEFFN